jgi:diaminopimelate decarboxylase
MFPIKSLSQTLRTRQTWAKKTLRPWVQNTRPQAVDLPISLWGLDAHPSQGLCYQGVALHGLLETYGSPLFVCLEDTLSRNIHAWHAHSQHHPVYGSPVFYSYKTHPVPGVLGMMHAQGVGAEVISPYELWLAEKMGVPASRTVYNGPAKSDSSLDHAIHREIFLIHINHKEEIARVEAAAQRVGKKARVGLRIQCGVGWGGQFGIPVANQEALQAFAYALRSPHLNVVSVHAHRGGHIHTQEEISTFLGHVMRFCKTLHACTGFFPSILDIGGSLGTPTVRTLSGIDIRLNSAFQCQHHAPATINTLDIALYLKTVYACVQAHMKDIRAPAPWVVFEPGKALTGNTHMLLTSVVDVQERAESTPFAVLDAGINVADAARFEYHQVYPVNLFEKHKNTVYALAGPICTPGDVLYGACLLPALKPKDSLAFMDTGAYWVPFSTSFSFPQPAIVSIKKNSVRLLRHAESYFNRIEHDVI